MALVRTSSGAWLNEDAAASYELMNIAFMLVFGRPLWISSGARTYAEQVKIFTTNNTTVPTRWSNGKFITRQWQGKTWYLKPGYATAAVPGTSNHEYPPGRAADFGSGVNILGSAEHRWMVAHAWLWGWVWTGKDFVTIEAWHFEKIGITAAASGGATPFEPPTKGFLMALTDKEQSDLLENVAALKKALLDGHQPRLDLSKLDRILEASEDTNNRLFSSTGGGWDAFDELIRGVRSLLALAGQTPQGPTDVAALAAAVREGLGDELADELAERLSGKS